jgi:hypothetical protein
MHSVLPGKHRGIRWPRVRLGSQANIAVLAESTRRAFYGGLGLAIARLAAFFEKQA